MIVNETLSSGLKRQFKIKIPRSVIEEKTEKYFNPAAAIIDELVSQNKKNNDEYIQNLKTQLYELRLAIILSIIGSLIIVTVISMFIGLKKISAPIQALTTQLKNLAEGDTTAIPVEPGRSDEIGVMQQALARPS